MTEATSSSSEYGTPPTPAASSIKTTIMDEHQYHSMRSSPPETITSTNGYGRGVYDSAPSSGGNNNVTTNDGTTFRVRMKMSPAEIRAHKKQISDAEMFAQFRVLDKSTIITPPRYHYHYIDEQQLQQQYQEDEQTTMSEDGSLPPPPPPPDNNEPTSEQINRLPTFFPPQKPHIHESDALLPISSSSTTTLMDAARMNIKNNSKSSTTTTTNPHADNTFWFDTCNWVPGTVPHSTGVGTIIGIVCGILAYLYYQSLEFLLDLLWETLPNKLLVPYVPLQYHWIWIPFIGYLMALGVGISVRYLGEPGDLSYTVQCVHDKAYIGMDHVLPMLCASQFSILGGGSLGPEAPLVAICASFGGYISRTIFRIPDTNKNLIRKHTLMGMACALSAFFGVPLGGSLFALEINNRFGIEYYEHTVEAIYSGTVCLCVFRYLANLSIGPIWQLTPDGIPLASCAINHVLLGGCIGLLGAGVAGIFAWFHQNCVMNLFRHYDLLHNRTAIQRALFGSTVIMFIGTIIPQTLFWGENEFQVLATLGSAKDLPNVYPTSGSINFEMTTVYSAFLVGVCKLLVISFTVAAGYRGGFIFPFFAAGACFGRVLFFLLPAGTIPVQLVVLCFAAGINVAITRTAMATTLILAALSGELNATPPILAASIVSLFATSYMPFIRGQAKRNDIYRHSEKVPSGPSTWKERGRLGALSSYGSNLKQFKSGTSSSSALNH